MDPANLNIFLAFVGGLVSFLSPCVLPLVPVYLGYMTGASLDKATGRLQASRLHIMLHAVAFVLGFTLIFVLFGATAGVLRDRLADIQRPLQVVSGTLLIIFGLHTLGVFQIPFLNYERRLELHPSTQLGYMRSSVIGIGFALGWTPCVGPILAGMFTLALQEKTVEAIPLFVAYSLGLGVPFLLAALVGRQLTVWLRKIMMRSWDLRVAGRTLLALNPISLVSGVLLLFMGVLLAMDKVTWLNQLMPQWQLGL
ncbi:MAG TPA: cytochrome c biogenesis protein CcdA [Chloroflexia bacterium]|nr:cytochrome c biogenesis protein CcdA [Chloroflexia bacterium]